MTNLCDCELSHNGLGITGRECDCPAGERVDDLHETVRVLELALEWLEIDPIAEDRGVVDQVRDELAKARARTASLQDQRVIR